MNAVGAALIIIGGSIAAGCGSDESPADPEPEPVNLAYATAVATFAPGPGAGFGQDFFPDVVLGPPAGLGTGAGSLDVLSLGVGGRIVLSFEDNPILEGPGVDFIVFENAFYQDNDPSRVFAELAEVSVSADGEDWRTFACDPSASGSQWPGCAGWRPTLLYDPAEVEPLEPALTGGDLFDLAEVGLAEARFVRIDDLSVDGEAPTAGFDLDAVGVIRR